MSATLNIGFAILTQSLGGPVTAPPPPPPATYVAPSVRPFEPGPGLGGQGAQGAESATPVRRPLNAPVEVEAYAGHYEMTPTDAELAYEQGVAQAEISMDRRMGALDGPWRVVGADGTELFTLVLNDAGDQTPVEGAWRDGHGQMGVAASTRRADGTTVLVLDGQCELRLAADGRSGVIVRDGQQTPVRLSRVG